jgi:hypothetical protein
LTHPHHPHPETGQDAARLESDSSSARTFARLQSIQTSMIDPRFDLRYIGDAAVQMALDRGEGEVLQRTREVKRRL